MTAFDIKIIFQSQIVMFKLNVQCPHLGSCVGTLVPQLVVLFGEVMRSSGYRSNLVKVGCCGESLGIYSPVWLMFAVGCSVC